jgi:hypothetical protein
MLLEADVPLPGVAFGQGADEIRQLGALSKTSQRLLSSSLKPKMG